ncbi:PREDICTED: uncharacterized protein LOC108558298 [Nicrophorus vespilloides]|uniref:Uncharacterized protein LOC108558298 n=1 Tax=Nicrophorus vespilloides TaxID=110193 RepID=A0ABM1M7W1_NICVS|nr:PREDICTED: uncharacterized protein LOC108558298 [Nicrophorus vespilloides]
MLKLLLTVLVLANYSSSILDTSALLSRQRRTLIYQPGLNWAELVVGLGLPVDVKDHSITWGAAVKSYYELPNNSTIITRPSIDVARKRREAATATTRWKLYAAVQMFAETFGYQDAKSCILKTICQAASAPFDGRTGLLSEVLHLFFTPSSTNEAVEDQYDYEYHAAERLGKEYAQCEVLFPECESDFMEQFTKTLSP